MSHQAETRIASLLVVVVAAVGVASASEIPRTASGKPDLSGNYDIGTLTPLQRSPEFGNRLFLTPAEAEEIRRSAAERTAQRSRPSDPNRPPPPFTGRLGGYNEFFHDRGTEAVAVHGKYRTSLLTDPPDGRLPPLTERGRERREGLYVRRSLADRNANPAWWRDLQAGPYDGPESLSIADRCIFTLEATIPVLPKNYNNLKTIVQTETHVMILIEWMHEARVIRLSPSRAEAKHLPPEIRSRSGDSVGWWEGDTLVVDTTNFLEESWGTVTLFGEPSPPAISTSSSASLSPTRTLFSTSSPSIAATGRRPTAASTPGPPRKTGCTSSPATKPTTRWATLSAAPASRRGRSRRRREPAGSVRSLAEGQTQRRVWPDSPTRLEDQTGLALHCQLRGL